MFLNESFVPSSSSPLYSIFHGLWGLNSLWLTMTPSGGHLTMIPSGGHRQIYNDDDDDGTKLPLTGDRK